ncbi:DUF2190 domain-containing protein [Varunaivibrio sulfuroxidans]|uniref:Uncharacterized protein n=1 Tax=Varunaivibrio sulfuroxidans TaxID=1773489 RepID=A0A4R3J9F2_9PROT|nr:DUF2190 domain-containing protein [Varunaivibrio sulfuroxidans]TCS62579.1 hypothetical protein EDD55_105125 [Varunaivibrio sulfuroxidans]WES30752.1 hypothetical protein P3M64_14145 [Varunaivibrio sulfuroxidans]
MDLGLIKNYTAAAAILPRRIVKFAAAAGAVEQAAAATDTLIGVTGARGAALPGDRIDVIFSGVVDVDFGGAIAQGDLVTTDATGAAVAAARHTHTENTAAAYTQNATTSAATGERIIGIAMVGGVAGDIGGILIAPGVA